jgi:hypothetical protein
MRSTPKSHDAGARRGGAIVRVTVALLSVATLLPLRPALAQEEPDQALINEGSRLRVMAPRMASDWLEGTLVSANDAGLVLLVTKGPRGYKNTEVIINRSSISRVAIPAGERRGTKMGVIIGGLAVGGLATFRVVADCAPIEAECTSGEYFVKIGGAVVGGALVGGVIGYFVKGTVWRELPMQRVPASAMVLPSGDMGLGLSLSF